MSFRLNLLADFAAEAGIGAALDSYRPPAMNYFADRDYGAGLRGVAVVFMCRHPHLSFKRRIRWSRKDQIVYLDIMLRYDAMVAASPAHRRRMLLEELAAEVPAVMGRYEIPDFDRPRFLADLRDWIARADAGPTAT